MADDHYEVLGVTKSSTAQEIKKSYRKIAKECHPDVAGDDAMKMARFKAANDAYEVLGDEVARARYDRRQERKAQRRAGGGGGSFREAFYRRTAETHESEVRTNAGHANRRSRRRVADPGNNLDLDDLFNDFGFGRGPRPGRSTAGGAGPKKTSNARTRAPMPQNGKDVEIDLDVRQDVARDGGTVTAVYYRMQRADSWRAGSTDAGVVRIQDIADIRLVPGTRDGEVLHEKSKGDAGAYGGPFGDLVVRVNIVADRRGPTRPPPPPRQQTPPRQAPPPKQERAKQERAKQERAKQERAEQDAGPRGPSAGASHEASTEPEQRTVDISVAEAVLGTRVELMTPQGRVRLSVPSGTNSGVRMRLRGKGSDGPGGQPADLFVLIRIVVPKQLDDESRQIMLRFGMLNPAPPRD